MSVRRRNKSAKHSAISILMAVVLWGGALGAEPISEKPLTVEAYCGSFAAAYAASKSYEVVADSIRVKAHKVVGNKLFNKLQPRGSRFIAGYQCKFVSVSSGRKRQEFTIDVYLVETLKFAEHTQWKDLQIVPIKLVEDESLGHKGYGVFKYLEKLQ